MPSIHQSINYHCLIAYRIVKHLPLPRIVVVSTLRASVLSRDAVFHSYREIVLRPVTFTGFAIDICIFLFQSGMTA